MNFFNMILTYTCLPTLGIPSSDSKNANLYFLDVVHQANTIFHLFDKQFNDHLMPLIRLVKLSDFHWYFKEYYNILLYVKF